jgi:hypothetical protein
MYVCMYVCMYIYISYVEHVEHVQEVCTCGETRPETNGDNMNTSTLKMEFIE